MEQVHPQMGRHSALKRMDTLTPAETWIDLEDAI